TESEGEVGNRGERLLQYSEGLLHRDAFRSKGVRQTDDCRLSRDRQGPTAGDGARIRRGIVRDKQLPVAACQAAIQSAQRRAVRLGGGGRCEGEVAVVGRPISARGERRVLWNRARGGIVEP